MWECIVQIMHVYNYVCIFSLVTYVSFSNRIKFTEWHSYEYVVSADMWRISWITNGERWLSARCMYYKLMSVRLTREVEENCQNYRYSWSSWLKCNPITSQVLTSKHCTCSSETKFSNFWSNIFFGCEYMYRVTSEAFGKLLLSWHSCHIRTSQTIRWYRLACLTRIHTSVSSHASAISGRNVINKLLLTHLYQIIIDELLPPPPVTFAELIIITRNKLFTSLTLTVLWSRPGVINLLGNWVTLEGIKCYDSRSI
jgi:hypothetical protein